MKFAFCLYKYFPYGGLQRDFIRIARECQRRGHTVKVYVLTWHGEVPDDIDVTLVPVSATFNHNKYRKFSEWVARELEQHPVDCVMGFNKMPGLDIYYAADSCFEEKARTQRGFYYKLLPRYRHFAEYERSVFGSDSKTEILIISEVQKPFFVKHYGTQIDRMHVLPPGISRDRIAPDNAEEIRHKTRKALGLSDHDRLVLLVGSGFIKKGLKRAILAVNALPQELKARTRFLVIGEDKTDQFDRLIKRLHLEDTVSIIGGSDEVPSYLLAGDLLLHPASDENAGMVLLEAMVSGLPVLATDVCGYGHYVTEAGMGCLVSSPFRQEELDQRLEQILKTDKRDEWMRKGRAFAASADIYSLPEKAVDVIERVMFSCSQPGAGKDP
ncbi:MAG: glycosyltransferase family 4 protein, partial [Bacteroidetes bacterium]|nr:glycosyltransferase family 4 protein [Bacteroidota bacterium]